MASTDTKDRILDSAEALFAKRGFASTSLRNVIAEAGVNLAAVHYHFGSREELIRAVFARRFEPINRERLRLLTEFEAVGKAGDAPGQAPGQAPGEEALESILAILVGPFLAAAREQGEEWSTVGLLVGRVYTEPDFEVRRLLHEQFQEVSDRFSVTLKACLTTLSDEEFAYRFHFVVAAMAVSLVHTEDIRMLSHGRIDPARDPEVFARRWISFAAAGLRAPATDGGGLG
jgi:AcrR family transcriptional regulator